MLIDDSLLDFVRTALIVVLKVSAPVLGAGIVIGLLISVFQSVTQVQEQTLALVPKIFIMVIVTILLLPWILQRIVEFTAEMFVLI